MASNNRHARTLEKLADQYERLLTESLVKFEKSIVNQLASAPTSADKLFDLQFALGMRQSLREAVEKEVLTEVHKAIANFDGAEKSLIEMYGASGIDEALLTVDRSIVRQLKKLSFQGFEDVAETFIDSISREIYQSTLTGKPLADSIRAVQQQINGVYIQTNDAEAQELVEFIAENKFDPSKQSAVDAAVEQLHTKYARDRVGNNLRRYATQQLHDGLMQYSASINMQMANQLGADKFKYFGTVVEDTRQWCKDHIGRVMTEQEIRDEWANNSWAGKSSSDPFIARGGYNCRHHFRAVFDEDAVDEVVDDKPVQQPVQEVSFGYPKGKFDNHVKNIRPEAKQVINKLPKPDAIVRGKAYYRASERLLSTSASDHTFRHEYGHFIDHQLNKSGYKREYFSRNRLYEANKKDAEKLGFLSGLKDDATSAVRRDTARGQNAKLEELKKEWSHREDVFWTRGRRKGLKRGSKNEMNEEYLRGMSDIIDSMTKGVFYNDHHMTGHGKSYYGHGYKSAQGSSFSERQLTENFANMFSIWSDNDKRGWSHAKKVFPNMTKEFEIVMSEVRDGRFD